MKHIRQLSQNNNDKVKLDTKTPIKRAPSPLIIQNEQQKINMRQSLPQLYQDTNNNQNKASQRAMQSQDVSPTFAVKQPIIRQKNYSQQIPSSLTKRSNYMENDKNFNELFSQSTAGRIGNLTTQSQSYQDNYTKLNTFQEHFNAQEMQNKYQLKIKGSYASEKNDSPHSDQYQNNSEVREKASSFQIKQFFSQKNTPNNGANLEPNQIKPPSQANNLGFSHYLTPAAGFTPKQSLQMESNTPSHEFQSLNSQEMSLNNTQTYLKYKNINVGGKQRILSLKLKVDSPSMSRLKSQSTMTANPKLNQQISPQKSTFTHKFLSPGNFRQTNVQQRFFNQKVSEVSDIDNHNSPTENFKNSDIFATSVNYRKADNDKLNENGYKSRDNTSDKQYNIQNKKDIDYFKDMLKNSKGFSNQNRDDECLPGNEDIEDQFRFIHKNIDKIQEKNQFYGQQSTFLVDLVSTMNKISLPPKKMNYLKENKNCSVLNINNFQLSSRQTDFFTKVINTEPYKNNLTIITANNNKITDNDVSNMLIQLPPKIEVLSLKSNLISNSGIIQISTKLQSNSCSLIQIDLENNKIRDMGAKSLFKALKQNNTLSKLNLSQNLIGDLCSQELKDLLESTLTLQELYLKWNNFRYEGGIHIAQGLKKNQSLRVFDISYNNFGSRQIQKQVEQKKSDREIQTTIGLCLSEAIQQNKKLIHFDMSYCNLCERDCLLIKDCLLKNTTLFGLHIEGNNNFFVDECGFVVRDESVQLQENENIFLLQNDRSSAFTNSILGVQYTENSLKKKHKDNCWICEGWEYLQFNYDDTNNTNTKVKGELYIHFDFDGYQSHQMQKISETSYQLHKMCPPNKNVQYFITEPLQAQIILDDLSNKITLKRPKTIQVNYDIFTSNISEKEGNIKLEVDKFNVIQTIQQNIFSQDYYQQVECNIREEQNISK